MSTSDGEGKEEGMQHQQKISQMRGGRRRRGGGGGLSIACVIQYGGPLLLLPPTTTTTKKLISMRGTSSAPWPCTALHCMSLLHPGRCESMIGPKTLRTFDDIQTIMCSSITSHHTHLMLPGATCDSLPSQQGSSLRLLLWHVLALWLT